MHRLFRSVIGTTALAILAACGGNNGASTDSTITGKFVDATVEGLGYKCGSAATMTGTTDANGLFTCKTGEAVAFYVGSLLLGKVSAAQAVVTPMDLVTTGGSTVNTDDVAVTNIVRLLMSLSSTDPATGKLTIDKTVVDNVTKANPNVDFATVTVNSLDTLISSFTTGANVFSTTVVTNLQARAHLDTSIQGLFAGTYSGTFNGSDSGTWSISIDPKGIVTGTATGSLSGSVPVAGQIGTSMGTGSSFAFIGMGGDTSWVGSLNLLTHQFSGTWGSVGNGGNFTGTALIKTPSSGPANPDTPNTGGTAGYPATASHAGKLSDGSACTVEVAADHSVTVSASNWAYTGGNIKTTLDGYYFDATNGEIAPAVSYTGTRRFFESIAGDYQNASATAPAYLTGLNFDASSGKLIVASGYVTTDKSFTPAAGANFDYTCAGDAYPAGSPIGASGYNKATPSRFLATTLVGGLYNAPTASNQACTFSVDASGNAVINWAGFTTTGGKLELPSTWLTTTADQTATSAKYEIYYNKTSGAVVGSNFGGSVVLNSGDSAVSDWFSATISQSGGNKGAVVMANGYSNDPKSVTCSTANDPAGKWTQVAAYAGTWSGTKDNNFHFGTNANCQLVVDAAGAMTYTDTAGAATAIDSTGWVVTPPNTGAYFDFAKNGTSQTFNMDFTGTTVSGTKPQAFFWKSGANTEYCNNMSKL